MFGEMKDAKRVGSSGRSEDEWQVGPSRMKRDEYG